MISPVRLVEPHSAATASTDQLLGFLLGYVHLLAACCEAREQNLSPGNAPVACRGLLQIGVGEDLLLWMLYQGHVHHFEGGVQAGRGVEWAMKSSAVLGETSAFALTPLGELFGELLVANLLTPEEDEQFAQAWEMLRIGRLAPRYDKDGRLLAWGAHVLKTYRQPSANQEIILASAEELSWTEWFDDPLPRAGAGNPKVRLHDAIKNLNRWQSPHLVRFKGNGTGQRVGWELR